MPAHDQDHAVRVETVHYFAPRNHHPGRVSVDFHVDREPNTGKYLAGEAANLLHGDLDRTAGIVESLATDHLRDATGTSARIRDDGYTISIEKDIPAAVADATENAVHSPGAESERPTAAADAGDLAELEHALRAVLPAHEQHHAETLARLIAAELPSPADVIQAYYRPTLKEVIDKHHRQYDPFPEPDLPPSLKAAHLSFPQHPSEALSQPPRSVVATTTYAISPGTRAELDR